MNCVFWHIQGGGKSIFLLCDCAVILDGKTLQLHKLLKTEILPSPAPSEQGKEVLQFNSEVGSLRGEEEHFISIYLPFF